MKNVFKLCLIACIGVLFTYCDNDDPVIDPVETKSTVKIKVAPAESADFEIDNLEGMEVKFTDTRTQNAYIAVLDASGSAEYKIDRGSYHVSIDKEDEEDGLQVIYSSRLESYSISEDTQDLSLALNKWKEEPETEEVRFIFSEIFFNGERNSGIMMHPDQYFVIFNPTKKDLYMDGLSVGVTYHVSWWDKYPWYDTYYPNNVPVRGFVTIPGSGNENLLKAGEHCVVAFTAIDHSAVEGYDQAVDLSGADFEIYYGPEANDVDNPNVPNLLITEDFWFQPRGYVAPLMFKLENGLESTVEKFYEENFKVHQRTFINDEGKEETEENRFVVVPTEIILDGVQTSDVPQDIKTRTIPETVDRGKFLVSGCHSQELAIRKQIMIAGQVHYQDTNNSTEDFILQVGQNSFPIGWRDKK